MAWRKHAGTGPAAPAIAEMARYADAYAASTDPRAAERLTAVESWLGMLRGTGNDPEIAAFFLEFARDDWQWAERQA
jgi:hypothetical protein